MSVKPTEITDDIYNYIVENYSAEDEFLTRLKAEATALKIPEIYISPDQGNYMQFLIKSSGVKNILEIGTLAGYSAIIMARALPEGGKVITVEQSKKHAEFAKKKISEAKLNDKIEVIVSDGKEYLNSVNFEEHFDLVFLDADKTSYSKYLDMATPMLKTGGIFVADNALAFGFLMNEESSKHPNQVKAILEFNKYFTQKEEYFTHLLTIGDGLIMGYKK